MSDLTHEQRIAKRVCNLLTQSGFKLMKKYKCKIDELGISDKQVAFIAGLTENKLIDAKCGYRAFEIIVDEFQQTKQSRSKRWQT